MPESGVQLTPGVDVSPTISARLTTGGASFVIEFRERADLSAAFGKPWNERGRYVHDLLRATADHSQAAVRRMLTARGITFESHWIKNAIIVREGDMATLRAVSALGGVSRIRELPDSRPILPEASHGAGSTTAATGGIGGNLSWIGTPLAWAQGTTGKGVTVGVIDNGVQHTHLAIVQQYRGRREDGFEHDYNWYDSGHATGVPYADGARGTAATGIIVGDDRNPEFAERNRIGMAPDAQWIACQGFPMDGDPSPALLACGEFMLAPTRRDGTNPDPDQRPQVVNNSWLEENTCDGNPTSFYADMVEAWVAAGIFPVFAVGNSYNCGLPRVPGLATVSSPASLGSSFAVGSTGNHDGQYLPYSLWGPSSDVSPGLPNYPDPRGFPRMKPQVVAPGFGIRTADASFGSDARYTTINGSAASASHISGLVALMLDAGECLRGDYATLGNLIMQTARPVAYASGGFPVPGLGNIPNYATGWGEINVPAAVDAAANACGPQGFIAGKVIDASGAPIAGAAVEIFVDPTNRVYQVETDFEGDFIRRVPQQLNGGYHMRVSAYGHMPSSEAGALVSNGATTRRDVQLAGAPVHKISGRITDSTTGWPLHARVHVKGYPGAPIWSDPVTGIYSVRLPEGAAFRFDVDTDMPGYTSVSRDLPSIASGGNQDFALPADLTACLAPGYRSSPPILSEDFENAIGAPPAGWTRSSAGLGWLFGITEELSGGAFQIPAHGRFAATNDELGQTDNDGRNDFLTMPVLNLAGLVHPVLRFKSFIGSEGPHATVEASTDGGITWSALGVPHPTSEIAGWGWTTEAVSLASVAVANVRLRFHSDDGTTDSGGRFNYGWAIDDVAVTANCSAPAQGGLLIGHVRDANTGLPLNGARITVNASSSVSSFTSADPGVGEGFYAIHAPAGSPHVKASRGELAVGYGEASTTPSMGNGATVVADLLLPAGRLRLYPSGPVATVELGAMATTQFKATNSGTQSLQFGFEQAAIEEHFEGPVFPPAAWSLENAGTGCSWRALDPKELGNFAGGHGGAAAINLAPCWGGENSDSSLITASIDLSTSNTASMGFFLSLSDGANVFPRLDVDVSRDGGTSWATVFTESAYNNGVGPGALIELDLTAFVGSNDVRVRFHFTATPQPWGWVMIDQVHLFNGIGMNAMLDMNPAAGTLAAGESRALDVMFDARTVSQPGIYKLPIRVSEDTPYEWPFGDVEATMTVTARPSQGSIGGTVQSLGYCDVNPKPLAGAMVTIQQAGGPILTTTTAADGSYRYWLEAAPGSVNITVNAAGHMAASRQVTVAAGAHGDDGFGLRLAQSCLLADPAMPNATVASGQSQQSSFELLNAGAAPASWTLRTGGDPAIPSVVRLVQTSNPLPEQDISFACAINGLDHALDNRYLRIFPLAENGSAQQAVVVSGVSFAIHTASSEKGTQPVTLRVYSLSGDLSLDHLHLLQEKTINVADMSLQRISVVFDRPLTVSGNSVLVAEIHSSGGIGKVFYPGGNNEGETASAYWMAPDCGEEEFVSFTDIGAGWVNLILEIDTLASDPCGAQAAPIDWLNLSQQTGNLGPDAGVPLLAQFTPGNRADGDYRGTVCATPGVGNLHPVVIPVLMHVGADADAIFANGFDG